MEEDHRFERRAKRLAEKEHEEKDAPEEEPAEEKEDEDTATDEAGEKDEATGKDNVEASAAKEDAEKTDDADTVDATGKGDTPSKQAEISNAPSINPHFRANWQLGHLVELLLLDRVRTRMNLSRRMRELKIRVARAILKRNWIKRRSRGL
jgi:cobalamin biosynthesis protein CobT